MIILMLEMYKYHIPYFEMEYINVNERFRVFFSMTTLENGHRNHDSTTLDHIQ